MITAVLGRIYPRFKQSWFFFLFLQVSTLSRGERNKKTQLVEKKKRSYSLIFADEIKNLEIEFSTRCWVIFHVKKIFFSFFIIFSRFLKEYCKEFLSKYLIHKNIKLCINLFFQTNTYHILNATRIIEIIFFKH